MHSDSWLSSSLFYSNPEEAEQEFLETLNDLKKKGQLDEVTRGYFSRTLRDRPSLQITLKFIRDHFPNAWVLDLGCGMGALEAEIGRSEKYECVGLDSNKSYVQLASLRLKLHGYQNTSFIIGDLRELPFKMDLFHMVVLHDVAFAVDLRNLIEEVAQVIKTGGRFVFDAPLALFYLLFPVQRQFIKYSKRQITDILKKEGFVGEYIFLPGMPPVLHERFHLPGGLMRGLSMLLISFPGRLQQLLGGFWFTLIFVARCGAKNT